MYCVNICDNAASGAGIALSAREYNRRGRFTVLLLHGFCCPSDMYEYQILPLVKADCRVITCDFCGFGRSDYPAHSYDYDCLAKQVNAVITALNLTCLCIVGYDAGGCAALRYLRLYRREAARRVRKLILLSCPAPFIVYEDMQYIPSTATAATTTAATASTATADPAADPPTCNSGCGTTATGTGTATTASAASRLLPLAMASNASYLRSGAGAGRFASKRRVLSETPVSNYISEVLSDKPAFCCNFVRNSFFANAHTEAVFDYYARMCADKSSLAGIAGMLKAIRDEDGLRDLDNADLPCTIVYGERDNFVTPATIELQSTRLRGSKLILLENSGHFIVYDQLEEFNDILVNEVVFDY